MQPIHASIKQTGYADENDYQLEVTYTIHVNESIELPITVRIDALNTEQIKAELAKNGMNLDKAVFMAMDSTIMILSSKRWGGLNSIMPVSFLNEIVQGVQDILPRAQQHIPAPVMLFVGEILTKLHKVIEERTAFSDEVLKATEEKPSPPKGGGSLATDSTDNPDRVNENS